MSSSDEKQSTIINNRSSSSSSSSQNQVILHDATKQKLVLYNRRSQQISLCQLRWYHCNNNKPIAINVSKLLMKTKTTPTNKNNYLNSLNMCPLCHQHLPSKNAIESSIKMNASTSNSNSNSNPSSRHMHRDYFMLLDRSYASDSRRSNSSSDTCDEYKQHLNYNNNWEQSLNNGYYNKFFEVVKRLGSGSYGTVHLVKHVMHKISLGLFAVKIICVGDNVPRLHEILREVRALQSLHHRNVIDYKHSWLENYQPAINGPLVPTLFILQEYADCGNIMDYIMTTPSGKPRWLSEHEIWTIMFETCMGLQHLHQYGIVHRDLKPNNLLMTSLHTRHRIDFEDLELYNTNYRIVLSDLGQSEFLDRNKRMNNRTGNTGTLGFAAPELIISSNNNWEWDESCDIWSLGHLLYFLAFSSWPYDTYNITDEYKLYKGIITNKYVLHYGGLDEHRSYLMIQLIDKLSQINKSKRPNLDWIIQKISNILKQHQYQNNKTINNKALPPPKKTINCHMGLYPVIKYVPKECNNQLRKRHKKKKHIKTIYNYDNVDDNDDEKFHIEKNVKEKKKNLQKKESDNQIEMTMFITMEKPITFLIKNGFILVLIGLIFKMELIFEYILPVIHYNCNNLLKFYVSICCVLLSFISNNNNIKYKKYMLVLYGLLLLSSFIYAACINNDWKGIGILFCLEIILLFIQIYSTYTLSVV